MWHSILKVDNHKQEAFMLRIFFLHNRAFSRSGKAASYRLSLNEWNNEVERMSLAVHICEQMRIATDHDGNVLFPADAMKKVQKRVIDGCLGHFVKTTE